MCRVQVENTKSGDKLMGNCRFRWSAMSLVEVMATITILTLLTVLAVPSLRTFQSRQSLITTQKGLQSQFYQMQQLALAPIYTGQTDYSIIGYGLALVNRSSAQDGEITIAGCKVILDSDLTALLQFIKFPDGQIEASMVGVATPNITSLNQPDCVEELIVPKKYPKTFYVFPRHVSISQSSQPVLPWLVTWPLLATAADFTNLCELARMCTDTGFGDPFSVAGEKRLLLINRASPDRSHPDNYLCREIRFSKDVTIQATGTIVSGGCDVSS